MKIEALIKKQRRQEKGTTSRAFQQGNKGYGKEEIKFSPESKGLTTTSTNNPAQAQGGRTMEQRRQASQCFRCGDKYTPGHQCRKQLLWLEGEEVVVEEEEESMVNLAPE